MNRLKFLTVLGAVLFLSACTNTLGGMHKDGKEFNLWAHGKPSSMEGVFGSVPKGYGVINREMMAGPVLKPAGVGVVDGAAAPAKAVAEPAGQKTGALAPAVPASPVKGAVPPMPPARNVRSAADSAPQAIRVNKNVTVYSLDDKAASPKGKGGMSSAPPISSDIPVSVVSSSGVRVMGQDNAVHVSVSSAATGTPVYKVFFGYGSADIDQPDVAKIADVAHKVGKNARVLVEGHASKYVSGVTDSAQRWIINQKMSVRRAAAVSDVLRKNGVPAAQISAEGFGDSRPNKDLGGMTQEDADRRVELYTE